MLQDHAYPADELMPLSCKGRYRGTPPLRGDIDDALGKYEHFVFWVILATYVCLCSYRPIIDIFIGLLSAHIV